jgi:hypothetical protein
MAWSLGFKPPLVRPIRRGTAFFEQAGGSAVGFEVCTIDHHSVRRARLAREPCEAAVEDAKAAPADEAVVEGFVRALGVRRVAPAQAFADNEDDAADDATIIDAGNAVAKWEEGLDPFHLSGREQENISHAGTSAMGSITRPHVGASD